MQDHDRVRARRAPGPRLPLALCWVLPRRSPPRMRMFWPSQHGGAALERVLGRLRQLALLDLRRDREGDEAEQQPADGDDQDPAQPGPLAAGEPRQKSRASHPPRSPCADAGQARLAEPVAQAGAGAVDAVRGLLPPLSRLSSAAGRGPLLPAPAACGRRPCTRASCRIRPRRSPRTRRASWASRAYRRPRSPRTASAADHLPAETWDINTCACRRTLPAPRPRPNSDGPVTPQETDRRRPGRDEDGGRGRRLRAADPIPGQRALDRAERGEAGRGARPGSWRRQRRRAPTCSPPASASPPPSTTIAAWRSTRST